MEFIGYKKQDLVGSGKPCTQTLELKAPCEETKLFTVKPIKLETGSRPNSAGIPSTLLLRFEAIGFPTFGLLP